MNVDVIKAVDSERRYQLEKWGDPRHSVAEWTLIIRKLTSDLEHQWFDKGDMPALHEVRQIAAVCVACMEQHGAPLR